MSAQPRTVRVAAIQALSQVVTEIVRSKQDPPVPVVDVLDFLRCVASDHPTNDTPELDAHLRKRFGKSEEMQ